MNKSCYRYYGGLLSMQQKWLNQMATKGYRLIRADKLRYEFEECRPGEYQYCVEFIGYKSKENGEDYQSFLEDMGYKVFFKNINLNYSIGKVRYRPWAENGGRIATNSTTFNRELLIVEKENDGKSFELHTSYEDKSTYYKSVRNPWITTTLLFLILGGIAHSIFLLAVGFVFLIPVLAYQFEIMKISRNAKTKEW